MKRDKSLTWQRLGPDQIDLTGQKAIVVGGTGGIGRALSRFLADAHMQAFVAASEALLAKAGISLGA